MAEAGTPVHGTDDHNPTAGFEHGDGGDRRGADRPPIGARAMALAGFATLVLGDGDPTWTVTRASH